MRVLSDVGQGIKLSEHLDGDGPAMFRHACAMAVRLGEAPMTLPLAVLSLSGSSFETLNRRRLPGIGGLPARRLHGGTWYDRTLRRSAAGRCFLARARDRRPSRRSSPLTRLGSLQSPRARNIGPGKVSGRGSGDCPDRP